MRRTRGPSMRVLRTILSGCKRLVFVGMPNRRQMMLMARHSESTAYFLRCLPAPDFAGNARLK